MSDDDIQASAAAYTSVRGTWAWRVKSSYAATARTAGKALIAVKVLPKTPPPRNQRLRHWLTSLTRVHDSLAIAELDVPWWTYQAIDVVDSWLSARPHPIRVFEWGSGASTFWLSARADEIYSVEHHPGFAELMRPELAKLGNVTFLQVDAPVSEGPRIGSAKTGSENLDFYDYVHAIDSVEGSFDVVVVDGRAREACMRTAIGRLAPGGLIIFDNSHRKRYKDAIAGSGLHERAYGGLTPTLPYPDRTSVLTVGGVVPRADPDGRTQVRLWRNLRRRSAVFGARARSRIARFDQVPGDRDRALRVHRGQYMARHHRERVAHVRRLQ